MENCRGGCLVLLSFLDLRFGTVKPTNHELKNLESKMFDGSAAAAYLDAHAACKTQVGPSFRSYQSLGRDQLVLIYLRTAKRTKRLVRQTSACDLAGPRKENFTSPLPDFRDFFVLCAAGYMGNDDVTPRDRRKHW